MTLENAIEQAVKFANRGLVLVSTSDKQGVPHIAAAGSLSKSESGRIAVTEWFCPETVANAVSGRPISVVVWDPGHDLGHQLIGTVSAVEEVAMLDGYHPEAEPKSPLPQVERRLIIEVNRVLAFRKAPHSDMEE